MLKNFKDSAMNLSKTYGIVLSGLFVALCVVFGLLKLSITPENRITFGFIPMAMSGFILGPVPSIIVGALGDIVGYLINPQGPYFPGFTISAMLGGLIYGLCLYKAQSKILLRVIIAKVIITFFVNIILNTYWLSIMMNKAAKFFAIERITKNIVALPVEIIIIFSLIMVLKKANIDKKL